VKRKLFVFSALALILIFGGLLFNVQNITPAPHLDDLDSGSLLDTLYAILLVGLVLFIAAGLGAFISKPFRLSAWSFLERAVIGLSLGLAGIAYGELFLGLIGWIQPIHQIIFLLVVAGAVFKQSVLFLQEGLTAVKDFGETWRDFSRLKKIFFGVGVIALLLALFLTFTPPYDYDGLMYHLQGPRLFLETGRIIPIPENWFTFYPATWEMLYMLGMGLGSDIFARLIAFSTLLLFLFVTYSFGKRFLPAPGGWLSAAMVIGVPMMLAWGGFAYIDLALSLFQFLAIGLLLIWIENGDDKLLVLSGIMQGLALGSKYTAFSGAAIIGLCVVWVSVKHRKEQKQPFRRLVSSVLRFGLPAIIVAFPWYLKNFLWTGNPIFPFVFHQEIIDPSVLKLWTDYLASFGTGNGFWDYFLLPITVFTKFNRFSTFSIFGDYPNPVMLLYIVYPFIRKRIKQNREFLDLLFIISILQFVFWAVSSQQTRFLMPLFPAVSILVSAVILSLSTIKTRFNWPKVISVVAVGGMLIFSLAKMGSYFAHVKPYQVLLGNPSKNDFLATFVVDYRAIQYINTNLPEDKTVLLLWGGKGYYCDGKCVPDIEQSRWAALIQDTDAVDGVSSRLHEKGITHLLVNKDDVTFLFDGHDPDGVHQEALSFLFEEFVPRCTEMIYEDNWSRLYEIHPDEAACQ
jgi:hypothetical protein